MTQQYTPAQLEAWAGLSWKLALSDDTTILDKDRRIVAELCCSDNEDSDHLDYNNPDEWPLLERNAALIAAAPDLARLVLEKDAEIARLKAAALDLVSLCSADVKMKGTTYQPMPNRSAFTKAVERMIELINKDRQAMKETSDE